ncbi:DUF6207 family protein [Streptomyces sp. NPDC005925]|uniref:DUF6207 family protein n=1 Tax=Streptomyces sp. NPDC005925 TaxID=3157172 RepID=UPI003405364F
MPGMKAIRDEHLAEPGVVVVDVAAADDATAFAFQAELVRRWATATATDDRTTRTPGEPGVRLRCYLDLRQEERPAGQPDNRSVMTCAECIRFGPGRYEDRHSLPGARLSRRRS